MPNTSPINVDVKTAVRKALQFVRELYSDQDLKDLALEEVKLSENEETWIVTVGFRSFSPHVTVGGKSSLLFPEQATHIERLPRDYKEVHINTKTGEPEPVLIHREI